MDKILKLEKWAKLKNFASNCAATENKNKNSINCLDISVSTSIIISLLPLLDGHLNSLSSAYNDLSA